MATRCGNSISIPITIAAWPTRSSGRATAVTANISGAFRAAVVMVSSTRSAVRILAHRPATSPIKKVIGKKMITARRACPNRTA